MLMFRFWGPDSRGADKTVGSASEPTSDESESQYAFARRDADALIDVAAQTPRKRRQASGDADEMLSSAKPAKKARLREQNSDTGPVLSSAHVDRMRDEIMHQFSLEILLKHDELRLINQELAKCQVALEQLRRCHLIPYPVNCPTPDQMLDISNGNGQAAVIRSGEAVPQWAPPFGVADGPYARHYAKWLIPDPSFDGQQPDQYFASELVGGHGSISLGRTTRNSFTDTAKAVKCRSGRSLSIKKLQSLSSGYPQPKEKAGPCILKRADGLTVKLVCMDCMRENFSSTQGFINHCRIAHKREFKSHEEAAVRCGELIDTAETSPVVRDDRAPQSSVVGITTVHPFARQDMSEQDAYTALRSRISDSLDLYHQGKLPGVSCIPSASGGTANSLDKFNAAPEAPHLSRLLQSRKFNGSLCDIITDAKTKVSLDDITPGADDSDDTQSQDALHHDLHSRSPVVLRVPARTTNSFAPTGAPVRPISSKGYSSQMSYMSPPNSTGGVQSKDGSEAILSDEEVDLETANLSPNTLVSNNAPSLVSDDGEYDDSDEGFSVSGDADNVETESVSDVAEISLDDDNDSRSLRRDSSSVTNAMKLRKDSAKHVTFMAPMKSGVKERRRRKAPNQTS